MTSPTRSHSHFMRSSPASIVGVGKVLGCRVVDRHGKEIGELHDLMFELSTGRIAYAVIELCESGNAAVPVRVVVPWNAIHSDADAQQLRVNAHADWVVRAPALHPGGTADHFVHEWGTLIHNYFGTRPYWEAPEPTQQYS